MKKIGVLLEHDRGRYLLAVTAGLLLTCAFPKIDVAGFAWIAPGIMLAAALGTRPAEAFRIGYAGGLAHYLSMLYWLLLIPYRWHGMPLGPALGWLALSGALSVFVGVWVWMMVSVLDGRDRAPEEAGVADRTSLQTSAYPVLLGRAAAMLPATWGMRALWIMSAGMVWVGLEMVMARVFGGFPWDLLGVSQYRMLPLIQVASFTGVYGVSFLVIWVSVSLVSGALMLVRRPNAHSVWVAEMFLPVLVTAGLFNLGFRIMKQAPAPERTVRVLLVQPSIPQTLIWDPSQDTNRFAQLVRFTAQALTNHADLVVWPESAVPRMIRYDTNIFNAITNLAQKHKVWMILGSDDAEPSRDPAQRQPDYFNSSFLISPRGELVDRYVKRSLVIFGEYVPLQRWVPIFKWFTPVEGGFTPGTRSVQFHLEDLDVTTSVLICFEDVFPQLGRTDVGPETDFLVNITNDGWFGNSAAQWQQAATALFRAVENRVSLIRCCNNGLSCWIDPQGRIREILRDSRGTIYGEGYLPMDIPIQGRGQTRALTFYTRHGDVFGWVCVACAAALLAATILKARLKREVSLQPPLDTGEHK